MGFPDNVLEARVARMTAYRSLYGQNQLLEQQQQQQPILGRTESPPPASVSQTPEVVECNLLLSCQTRAHSLGEVSVGKYFILLREDSTFV